MERLKTAEKPGETEGREKAGSAAGERRAKRMALAFILAPILATFLWGLYGWLNKPPEKKDEGPIVALGAPAPEFTFPALGGGAISLADYRGKVVLVNIWATWCPPCIDELPSLQNLYLRMKEKGQPFEILGVSIDALGADAVQKFVERFKLTFPIPLDPRGQIKKLYRTTGVPESFFVDPQGRLVEKIIGARKWDSPEVISFVEQMLRNAPAGGPAQAAPKASQAKP
ncbi:MAG: TlpA family protein disulfide reductase [Candidatus Tectomicrobia bacterium]|uniref:TlpA family protein disulfide reductase n=1 Tax=Tectimicrobiota bacterium TaxID=2528274 RepID=A0A932MQ20_UNCTE|nr:TlpA family protein disulfide reductase [Candidatus Tectomicrobia bacterium]